MVRQSVALQAAIGSEEGTDRGRQTRTRIIIVPCRRAGGSLDERRDRLGSIAVTSRNVCHLKRFEDEKAPKDVFVLLRLGVSM